MIGKDVQGTDREWMLAKATPWPVRHAADPISLSEKFDAVKSAYIFCTGSGDPVDEIVAGKWGKLEGPYKIIDTGHWPMITKPTELLEAMLSLTSSSGGVASSAFRNFVSPQVEISSAPQSVPWNLN